MTSRLNAYLSFPENNAREAMEFYRSVLGGELDVLTFGEMGETGGTRDLVMHSRLHTEAGYDLMGADAPPGMPAGGRDTALCLSGDEEERLRGYWEKLLEGAQVVVPLEEQPWGDHFGQLVDRFGVTWMVDYGDEGTATQ